MKKTKQYNNFYYIWAILFAIFPILVSATDLIGIKTNIEILAFLSFVFFIFSASIRLLFLLKKDYKLFSQQAKTFFSSAGKSPIFILTLVCCTFAIISSFVNGFNFESFIFFSYLIIFFVCCKMSKSKINSILNILIISTMVCCIMGFIDPKGESLPGFNYEQFNLSLQFYNPNHSSYVMATMLVLSAGLLQRSKMLIVEIFYTLAIFIYAFFLCLNGTFAGITFAFISLGLKFIFYLIKFKKFPLKIVFAFLIMFSACLLIEFVPDVNSYRTIPYNYFAELIEVVNHYFKLDIPIPKVWGASKEYLSNASTADAYTFTERERLLNETSNILTSNSKNLWFGVGAGSFWNTSPHNLFMSLALEFGIIVPICIGLIIVITLVKFLRNKSHNEYLCILFSLICFVMCAMTGSLTPYSGIYLFILLGLCSNCSKNLN